jgi:hypothetical protein
LSISAQAVAPRAGHPNLEKTSHVGEPFGGVVTVRGMDEKWWLDQQLVELRAIHVATLAAWDAVRPEPGDLDVELSAEQVEAMRDAIDAEEAYYVRRRELGLR